MNHEIPQLLIRESDSFPLWAEDQRAELDVHFHRAEVKMMMTKMERGAKDAKRSAKS